MTADADHGRRRRSPISRSSASHAGRLSLITFAVVLVVGLTVHFAPAREASADGPTPTAGDCTQDGAVTTGAIFNNPHTDDADRIHRHIGCLIDGAPSGAKINIAGYHFADDTITTAVTDAIHRGVQVRVIVDGNIGTFPDDPQHLQRVQTAINDVHDGKSEIKICPSSGDNFACIANRRMHNKLVTVSETHGTPHVTFLTSSNYEDNGGVDGTTNSGLGMWNSGYTAADDEPLYKWFAGTYLNDLAEGKEDHDYYGHHDKLKKPIGNYRVFHSPRAKGITALTDALNKVKCDGSDSGGTNPGHRTIVRVAMWTISDTGGIGVEIAKKLWALDNAGCYVDVVATDIGTKSKFTALRTLLQKPERANSDHVNYHGPEVREFNSAQKLGLHEKNLMIDGTFDGDPNRKVVFTGSYNFTQSSAANPNDGDDDKDEITVNDETWLQINDAGVHDRFVDNFFDVRNAAHTCWQTSKPKACDGGRTSSIQSASATCHAKADTYADKLYLYRGTYCKGEHDGKADKSDSDYGDGKGQVKDLDNAVDSIVNTTKKTIKFYNYPEYNKGHSEGDSFCLRPDAWVNKISLYGDGSGTWSNSISSHRVVDDPKKDCDRWFGGYHEPNR